MPTRRFSGIATSASVPDNGGDNSGGVGSVDDVFSTYVYEGNNNVQKIESGIDLAGEGGLVWTKCRTASTRHVLTDTESGYALYSNEPLPGEANQANVLFNSDGHSLNGGSSFTNGSGQDYVSWTFRKAPNFFDVVTYTGDGVAGREIPHNLGCEVGFAIVKRTDAGTHWYAQHKDVDLTGNKTLYLSLPGPLQVSNNAWNSTHATSENLIVGDHSDSNGLDGEYVAYLFAHDDSDESMIKCGSFTTPADGTTRAVVELGWEPQWVLTKSSSTSDDWQIIDSIRGITGSQADPALNANSPNAEANVANAAVTSTGFEILRNGNQDYIYMAIRKPDTP